MFPKPSLTVDTVVFSCEDKAPDINGKCKEAHDAWEILLIKRKNPPYKERWALPGGFVNENEPLSVAAARELREETSLDLSDLEQIGAFGDPGRDPRGWTVTVAYATIVFSDSKLKVKAADDAKEAKWFPVKELPSLAFDHMKVIQTALARHMP